MDQFLIHSFSPPSFRVRCFLFPHAAQLCMDDLLNNNSGGRWREHLKFSAGTYLKIEIFK